MGKYSIEQYIDKRIIIHTDYDFDTFKEVFGWAGHGDLSADLMKRLLDMLTVVDGKIVTNNGDKKINTISLPYNETNLKECETRGWKYEIQEYEMKLE